MTLAYLACKMNLCSYINSDDQLKINGVKKLTENKYISICEQIRSISCIDKGTNILFKAFNALIAAIYIDSNGQFQLLLKLAQKWLFEDYQLQCLLQKDYIQQSSLYIFLQWYQENFGDPSGFDLIKIPHQDYEAHRYDRLYIPYDNNKGEIVNLKQHKLQNIKDLHIFAHFKNDAWRKVVKYAPLNKQQQEQ